MNTPHPCASEWLALHDHGFSTFPLQPGQKKPTSGWKAFQSRRATDDELAGWLNDGNGYNVGVATGAISGIAALDLDSPEAEALAESKGLPPTPEVKTPRGRHLYFKHPGFDIRNTAGKLAGNIDFRGDGGYVVGPGSYFIPTVEQAADGKVEGAYEWVQGRSPTDLPFADLPAWAIPCAAEPPPASTTLPMLASVSSSRNDAYAAAALAEECKAIRLAPKGQRNHQLNASAFAVAQLVGGGMLDGLTARHEVEAAATMAGLSKSETVATINSAWKGGLKSPRGMPDEGITAEAPVMPPAATTALPTLCWFSAASASHAPAKEREWLIDGWLPVGATTLLTGDGGMGKTLVAQQMATAVASGQSLWGQATTQAPVLALYCEDDRGELNRRQRAINDAMGLTSSDVASSTMASGYGVSALLGSFDKAGAFHPNQMFAAIRDEALATGARLIILDNINMVFGDNINDPGAVTRFVAGLNGLAIDINGAVLLLGHIAKGEGSRFAGTTAWSNAVRNRLFLGRPDNMAEAAKNPNLRHLTRDKSNYARTGDKLELQWQRGALVGVSDIEEHGRTLEQVEDDKRFLSSLDRLTADKIALSVNSRASNYAPKMMAEFRAGLRDANRKKAMAEAMGRLLMNGTILPNEKLGWIKPNRHEAEGIKRANDILATTATSSTMEVVDALKVKTRSAVKVDLISHSTPAVATAPVQRQIADQPEFARSEKVQTMMAMMNARRGIDCRTL